MATGNLTIKMRPIRLALIVLPSDKESIRRAVRINSYLWGGQYNPIIPLFRKLPAWVEGFSRPENVKELFSSYLDLYAPDFVVRLGLAKNASVDLKNIPEISEEHILAAIEAGRVPTYGIGLAELLSELLVEEFRFIRCDSLCIKIPEIGEDLFLASIFGIFPSKLPKVIGEKLKASERFGVESCSRNNYVKFFNQNNLFTRRISNYRIEQGNDWSRGDWIFLMNPDSLNDILLYWNYRALGWNILPVPIREIANKEILEYSSNFIEENYKKLSSNYTNIFKSPGIKEAQIQGFIKSLKLAPSAEKISVISWIPQFWDRWTRSSQGASRAEVLFEEKSFSVRVENESIKFDSLVPSFAANHGGNNTPRCANQLELRIYDEKQEYAQVIPAGGDKMARAAHFLGLEELRCTDRGMVYFPRFKKSTEIITAPTSESIFNAWFEERGWKVEISDKGHIIKQLMHQLGGFWKVRWLTDEAVLRFLTEIPRLGSIGAKDLAVHLNKIVNASSRGISKEGVLGWLVDSKILRLGLDIPCPKCRQRSWYSVAEADYELACRQCMESYHLPEESLGKIGWAYRGVGAFGSKVEVLIKDDAPINGEAPQKGEGGYARISRLIPDKLQGSLPVLLLLNLLLADMHPLLTPLMSFNAKGDDRDQEIDLGAFVQHMRHGAYQQDVVFAECKSFYARFGKNDVEKMERFARHFPGAIMIFATMRRELDTSEKKLLAMLASRWRRAFLKGRPNNPLVIFTGNELFSQGGPRAAWRKLGGLFAKFGERYDEQDGVFVSLADTTQQLYLGLPSVYHVPPISLSKHLRVRKPGP